MNRPHQDNPRFVHTFIRTVTTTPIPIAPLLRILNGTALILLLLAAPATLQADTCDPIGSGGAPGISAQITIDGTTTTVTDQALLPAGTQVRIDSVAEAYGQCVGMFWYCNNGCSCQPSGDVQNRTVNHTTVTVDASTANGLNGNYVVGYVYGRNPNGTTAFWNVLDSQASNSTGPNYFTLSYPGTYQFHVQGIANPTACNIQPSESQVINITINVEDADGARDFGTTECHVNVGKPVNVTNGNMYLTQTDYRLPGIGDALDMTRTYNSKSRRLGLFGHGWSTQCDESINAYGSNLLRLNLADGRAIYFKASSPNNYQPFMPLNFYGQIIKSGSSYALTFKDGRVHQFSMAGRLLSQTDTNGNQTSLTYGSNGNPATITDPFGRTITLAYNSDKQVTSITDSNGVIATYTYDWTFAWNNWVFRLRTVTYPDGSKFKFEYSSPNFLVTVKDTLDNVLESHTYDSQGRALTSEVAGNGTERYTLDYFSATETDVTDALNHVSKYFFDTSGQLLTVTDPRNNATSFTYDAVGNPTRRTDALNNQTNVAYDARGRVTSTSNALNQTTSYEYDLAGRLKKVIYPDTNFVLFTYDLAGRRTKIKDPRGYETNFAYDAVYRLTSETNAATNVTSYAYDAMSNLTGVTDALSRTTNYTYDDFNRLTKIKYPEASAGAGRLEENFAYDLAGNLLTKTDQAGRVTTFCYDNVNRLTSTVDPAQKTTAYEYNARSQMTAVVDAVNQRYEFVYDAVGRRTQEKKDTATMSFAYDAVGNRSQRTDYNSAVTNYTYDALNRLTTISYPDATSAAYGYDALSRLTTGTNPTGTDTIAYDNRSRVSSVTDVFGQAVGYTYDANSNRTQLSLNGGTSATYQYDVINRLTQLADAASLNSTFSYDVTDKLTSRTLPNGVVTTAQYDGLNRLTRLTHSKGANTLADFQYQFNAVNNITQMTDSAGAHNYTYDPLDRLTTATHPSQSNESYTFDDVGNRTASHQGSSYTYQAFNRLVVANGASFGYDATGNLTSKTDASGSWTYTWDYENRLKQAIKPGAVTVTYAYDALGRRVQRTSSTGSTAKFVYDGADVVRDLDGSGSTIADYLNGPGIDNRLRQTSGGTASYFVIDHLHTTRALSDSTGNITSNLSYDSFGNVMSGSAATRYTYTGREIDSDTGFMYYRARWYDPQHARFLSEDPIGLLAAINLYAYVANDSVNSNDPSGLERLQPYHLKGLTSPQTCECHTMDSEADDDSFLSLMGSYGKGVANGFADSAIGSVELPIDFIRDPAETASGIMNDIDMRIQTIGQIAAHPIAGKDAIIDAIVTLGPNKAMEILGNAGGQAIFFKSAGEVGEMARYGREIEVGESCRIAPFGNRTSHPTGRWPHYHRRVPDPKRPGEGLRDQGIGRHRPWDTKPTDRSWKDRF